VTVPTGGFLADIEVELSRAAWIAAGAALIGHVRQTDTRFDAIDRRFDRLDARVDAVQAQLNRFEVSTNERFDRLDGRIEYLIGLIIRSETKGQEPPAATDG
jgi:hypothetical protein